MANAIRTANETRWAGLAAASKVRRNFAKFGPNWLAICCTATKVAKAKAVAAKAVAAARKAVVAAEYSSQADAKTVDVAEAKSIYAQENISLMHWLVSVNIIIFFMKVFSTSCELDRSLNMLLYYEVYSIFHVALFAFGITVVVAFMDKLVYQRHKAQPPVSIEYMV